MPSASLTPPYFIGVGSSYYLIVDCHNDKAVYVSPSIEQMTGYLSGDWTSNGMDYFAQFVHPEDRKRLGELMTEVSAYYASLPMERKLNSWGSYTFRFRRADGSYFHLLRQDITLKLTPDGKPHYALWYVSDISHLKTDNRVVATITQLDSLGNQLTREFTSSRTSVSAQKLSMREQEIIQMLAQGMSNKQIAQKLNLSFHTITTHKRNIFEKTNSHNAHALVGFAHRNGII